MSEKTWKILPSKKATISNNYSSLHKTVIQILINRQINTDSKIEKFINPDFKKNTYSPNSLKSIKRAISRLELAVKNKEIVCIYGDYDTDGVTSSTLLYELCKNLLGLKGYVYIPDRTKEGYGLNNSAINWINKKKVTLIITCDCGISNKKEIDYASSKGIDTIVTDHHNPPQKFNNDYIVINPKQKDDNYPFKELAGVGVVYKFIQAIFLNNKKLIKPLYRNDYHKWFLDLVALGTVADCCPLVDENRTLVKYGLKVLKKTKRNSLKKIIQSSGYNKKLNSYTLSFILAPRINAAGRIDHANTAFKLLTSNSPHEINILNSKIEKTNSKRQNITSKIISEAEKEIKKISKKDKIIILDHKDWPLGVIGIVAGKLCEKYSKPVIVFNKSKNEYTGSARSINSFNIIAAITKFKKFLTEYGGHTGAAGLSLKLENFNDFKKNLIKYANKKIDSSKLVPTITIDSSIELKNINHKLLDSLEKLEPYGEGNPEPVFITKKAIINNKFLLGKNQNHTKLIVSKDNSSQFPLLCFNNKELFKSIKINDTIDLVYRLSYNIWNGNKSIQMELIDYKLHEKK